MVKVLILSRQNYCRIIYNSSTFLIITISLLKYLFFYYREIENRNYKKQTEFINLLFLKSEECKNN